MYGDGVVVCGGCMWLGIWRWSDCAKMNLSKVLPSFIRERLASRPTLARLFTNTVWLFADRVLQLWVGLFVGIWVARYLGPDKYGLYNFSLAFVLLFTALIQLGLDGIVVRDIVRDPSCKEETLGTSFTLKLLGSSTAFLLAFILIILLRPSDSLTHWLVFIMAAGHIFQAFDTIDLWFQSQIQSKFTVIAKNSAFLLIAVVKIALILFHAPLIAFAWAAFAQMGISAVGLVIAYKINKQNVRLWRCTIRRAKSLLNDSWPLILSSVAIMIQAYIDQVMLGQMIGASEVGQYSAAMKLIVVFGFVPVIIKNSVAPKVTEAKVKSEAAYYQRLLNIYRLMFILFLAVVLPVFLIGEKLVILLYGVEYQPAGFLFSLFAIRLLFTNFGVARSLFITNNNLFRYSLVTAIIGSILNVTLNYILIPQYASIGAIWATIVSFFTMIFLLDIFYFPARKNLWNMLKAIATPWRIKLN